MNFEKPFESLQQQFSSDKEGGKEMRTERSPSHREAKKEIRKIEDQKEKFVAEIFWDKAGKDQLPELDDQLLDIGLVELPEIEKNVNTKLSGDVMRQAVILKFGLKGNNAHTYEEIGSMFGVSKERIRQLINKALRIFRRHYYIDKTTKEIIYRG